MTADQVVPVGRPVETECLAQLGRAGAEVLRTKGGRFSLSGRKDHLTRAGHPGRRPHPNRPSAISSSPLKGARARSSTAPASPSGQQTTLAQKCIP